VPPALPGSEADPTGFQPLRSSPCFAKRRLLNRQGNAQLWGHPRSVWRSRTRGVVRDVFEEGWQECKSGLQVSTTGGPFLTRTLARGCIYTFPFQSPRCGAGCPGMFLPVLMTLGKCSCFRAKAAHISGHLPQKWQNPGFLFRGFLEFYIYYLTVLRLQERCSCLLLV